MRLPLALAALAAVTVLALGHQLPADAAPRALVTCSAGEPWDPIDESDVIVAGRIVRHEIIDAPQPIRRGYFTPVELHVDVDRVLKGAVAPSDRIVDVASLMVLPDPVEDAIRVEWSGSAGACGVLDHEPDGWYAILGLRRVEGSYLQTNRLTTFYLRSEPFTQETFVSLHERLGLPASGSGAREPLDVTPGLIALALLGAGAVAAGASGLGMRR
jgi:hypothetical protein